MRLLLKIIFAVIFLWMVGMTTYVSLHKPLWLAGSEFSWVSSPWTRGHALRRLLRLPHIFCLGMFQRAEFGGKGDLVLTHHGTGNIAMSGYVLIQLFRLKSEERLSNLVLRTSS